jgi:3'(2'), 5'-bisphosphate nucleotidase
MGASSFDYILLEDVLAISKAAAHLAGKKIQEVIASGNFEVEMKSDNSPVTVADRLSNEELCKMLHIEFPSFGIVTEEAITGKNSIASTFNAAINSWNTRDYCFFLDPLDGTKDFMKKTGEYGIHIGLTFKGTPVLGFNYYPAIDTAYSAIKNRGSYKETENTYNYISVSDEKNFSDLQPITSRSMPDDLTDRFIEMNNFKGAVPLGSAGYKICKVADGSADIYTVFRPILSLWDVCSGQVIIEEARGQLSDCFGHPVDYKSNPGQKLQTGLIVSNGRHHDKLIDSASKLMVKSG